MRMFLLRSPRSRQVFLFVLIALLSWEQTTAGGQVTAASPNSTSETSMSSTAGSNSSTTSTTTKSSSSGSSDSTTSTTAGSNSSSSTTTKTAKSTSEAGSSTSTTSSTGSSGDSTTTTTGKTTQSSSTIKETGNSSSTTSGSTTTGGSSTNSSTTGQSGGTTSTTAKPGNGTSSTSNTSESGSSTSGSSTTSSSNTSSSTSSSSGGSGTNSSNSSTTQTSSTSGSNNGSTTATTSSSGSSNGTSSGGVGAGGSGVNSGNSTTSSPVSSSTASGNSSIGAGSPSNYSSSKIFLQPGSGQNNLDITTKGDYFNCGSDASEDADIRMVLRYDKTVMANQMNAYLNSSSSEYKAEQNNVTNMPPSYNAGGNRSIVLKAPFSLSLARKVDSTKVEFEIFCKVVTQADADVVAKYLQSTQPYASWDNMRYSKACDMRPNRVVPIALKFTEEIYVDDMRDRKSAAFLQFATAIKPGLLQALKSQILAVQEVLVLSMSNGSVVVETAVMVDSSGTSETTKNIQTIADGTKSINGKPTQTVQTTQTQNYVTAMDTVNSVPGGNGSSSAYDTELRDDKVGVITTARPGREKATGSNGYFLNVTVPSFLALILLIAILLFCTVNSNSCLCRLCASNVKKDMP